MSVTRLRELMATKGCQIPMMVVGLLLIVGFALLGVMPSTFNQGSEHQEVVVATVGKANVSAALFEKVLEQETKGHAVEVSSQPEARAMLYQRAMSRAVMLAAVQDMADEQKVKVEDKDVVTQWEKNLGEEVKKMKEQLKAMGKTKEGSTEAEVDAALSQALGGRDYKTVIAEAIEEQKGYMANPSLRMLAVAPLLQQTMVGQAEKTVQFGEPELKASYDQLEFEVVQFRKKDQAEDAAQTEAAKGLADLKAGKTFDEVRKAYGRPLAKDEKATQSFARGTLEVDPTSKDLLNLKPGELSGVVNQFGEVKVMKLLKVENKLPEDFEKTKATQISQRKQALATKKLGEALEKRVKEQTKWASAGFGALHRYVMVWSDQATASDEAKRAAAVLTVWQSLAAVKDDLPRGKEALALTQLACSSDLYQSAKSPEDKTKWGKARLDALSACFDYSDNATTRLTAAKLASEVQDKEALATHLLEAVRNNALFNAQGAEITAQATQLLAAAKAAKTLTPEAEGAIQRELDRWQTEKATAEKEMAELEKEKRAAEAEAKSASEQVSAEEAKALEEAKGKPAPAPVPVPVVPGVGGGK